MKTAILSILIFFSFCGELSNPSHQQILKEFFKAISLPGYQAEDLKKRFIAPSKLDGDDTKRDELISFQLASLHQELKNKDLSKIAIADYSTIEKAEQDIRLYKLSPNEKAYVVRYEGKYITTILLEDNRIKSVGTINKGGSKTFLVL